MAGRQPWKIRPHGDRCCVTGVPFREGEVFYSCLIESGEPDLFLRQDYSESAWQNVRARHATPFSFWRSVYAPKPVPGAGPASVTASPSQPETLLQRLVEEASPETERVRFLLAILLERKRVLRQVGQQNWSGQQHLLYEHLPTGEILLIPVPGIAIDQVSDVARELQCWLEPETGEKPPAQATASA